MITSVVLAAVLAAPVSASTDGAEPVGQVSRKAFTGRPAHDRAAAFDALIEAARKSGPVPVVLASASVPSEAPSGRLRADLARQAKLGQAAVETALGHNRTLRSVPGAPVMALTATVADLKRLKNLPQVHSIAKEIVVGNAGTSSFGAANGVQLPRWWDQPRIGLDWTRANGYKGYGKRIVVIDSGVDSTHPWLRNRVVQEACFSRGGCGNGLTYRYGTGSGAPCRYAYSCAHGTHVAHTAAGQYGVAPSAGIVAINASTRGTINGQVAPTYSNYDLAQALWYAYTHVNPAPAAVNLSIGGTSTYSGYCDSLDPIITQWIAALAARGTATVIASGNGNSATGTAWPGCISTAVTVGNTTLTSANGSDAVLGNTWGGSNSSTAVDLLAPGTDICSAVPTYLDPNDVVGDGRDCSYYGTSMAAPQVAGAFALMKEGRPGYTVAQTLSALHRRGVSVADARNGIVRSRINVANAIFYG